MSLVDTVTAKLHLRVDSDGEDTLIAIWLGAADLRVTHFLNRNVYADQPALTAAIAAAPAALTAATAVYDAAILAAEALDDEVESVAATKYAEEAYAIAQTASDMAQRGMVLNDMVKAAILLTVADLYENRGDGSAEPPKAAQALLWPSRVAMGI